MQSQTFQMDTPQVSGRVYIRREVRTDVRVPDTFLRGVGFLAACTSTDIEGESYDHEGTGFFVSIHSAVVHGFYSYFVTAKHLLDELQGKRLAVLLNDKNGGVLAAPVEASKFFYHPSDKSVDVAVTPVSIPKNIDIIAVPQSLFMNAEMRKQQDIGIGDEVFAVGLFTFAPGHQRNMPIIRYGTIAMFPDEAIQVDSGFAEVYLIEARSIGGLSGSPVFVRQTVRIKPQGTDSEAVLHGVGTLLLLGMMHGHWDIKPDEQNKARPTNIRPSGVNMGIGVVVPAEKILEVINHPDLVARRETAESQLRAAVSPGLDSAV